MNTEIINKWNATAWEVPGPVEGLRFPYGALTGEAVDVVRFCQRNWKPVVGQNKQTRRPGLVSAVGNGTFTDGIAEELLEILDALQAAQTRYRLLVDRPSAAPMERAQFVLGELRLTLEWLFDDGKLDEADAQLQALANEHGGAAAQDTVAAALFDYAELAARHRDHMAGLGGFDVALIEEAPALGAQLRELSAGPGAEPTLTTAGEKRRAPPADPSRRRARQAPARAWGCRYLRRRVAVAPAMNPPGGGAASRSQRRTAGPTTRLLNYSGSACEPFPCNGSRGDSRGSPVALDKVTILDSGAPPARRQAPRGRVPGQRGQSSLRHHEPGHRYLQRQTRSLGRRRRPRRASSRDHLLGHRGSEAERHPGGGGDLVLDHTIVRGVAAEPWTGALGDGVSAYGYDFSPASMRAGYMVGGGYVYCQAQ